MIKKHIPNFITCMNLFAGSLAVYYAFQGQYTAALILILIAALFDFLDGMAARVLKAYSPMGKELDSLADMISFGLVPGAVAFSLLMKSNMPEWVSLSGFLLTIFSALRLAKFNIDERQSASFLGLPTPANAIFWMGLGFSFSEILIANSWIIVVFIVFFSFLLVSEIPMFSLKFSSLNWKVNQLQYLFLLVCIVLLVVFQLHAFAPIIGWYILLSAINALFKKH